MTTHIVVMFCALQCNFVLFFMTIKYFVKIAWNSKLTFTIQCFSYEFFAFEVQMSNLIFDVDIFVISVCVINLFHLETQQKVFMASVFFFKWFVNFWKIFNDDGVEWLWKLRDWQWTQCDHNIICHAVYSYSTATIPTPISLVRHQIPYWTF